MTPGGAAVGIVAVLLGYLIGSFPSAYVVTRLVRGKDIRALGTGHTGVGNAGARNVFVNVGKPAGVAVAALDIIKGVGAVALAQWVIEVSTDMVPESYLPFVLGAGVAAVAGHIWPVYLRFRGGAGLATTIGVLSFLMIREVAVAFSFALVFIVITRNVVLSANLAVALVPLLLWWNRYPWFVIVFPILLIVVMLLHFTPNILAEIKKAGSAGNLVAGLMRRENKRKRRA